MAGAHGLNNACSRVLERSIFVFSKCSTTNMLRCLGAQVVGSPVTREKKVLKG